MSRQRGTLRKTMDGVGTAIVYIFLIAMVAVAPLYVETGYVGLGDAKFKFFKYAAGSFSAAILVYGILYALLFTDRKKIKKISVTDCFAVGYAAICLLSYLCSSYRETALWGANGWNMGLMSQLFLVGIYFGVSRLWDKDESIVFLYLAVSSVVYMLGIFNRFGWYPIEMKGANSGFISTLGNINWYCSYVAVVLPVGMAYFWRCTDKVKKWLIGGYVFLGFCTLVTQGSNSVFLGILAVFTVMFYESFSDKQLFRTFAELVLLLAMAGIVMSGFIFLQGESYNYQSGIGYEFCTGGWAFVVLAVGIAAFFLPAVSWFGSKKADGFRKAIPATIVTLIIGYVLLVILNTLTGGGLPVIGSKSSFIFNSAWGSGRGATWIAGFKVFAAENWWQKLIGIGSDCFAQFAYDNEAIAEMLHREFGELTLTNAHNEWITMLADVGVLGCMCYAGIFISAIVRGRSKLVQSPLMWISVLAAVSYVMNNMVSFQQSINAPQIFILMGMGEAIIRQKQ